MRSTASWKELGSAVLSTLGVVLTLSTLGVTPVEARRVYQYWHPAYRHVYHPYHAAYARRRAPVVHRAVQSSVSAMVVDANTGKTLYASNEDQVRHPASITKVMTLYLLFEQMEKGRFSLDTPIRISDHAAAQAPTKLGLDPGDTIRVEDAIKAIVTESANDIAVAVAEAIGGDESTFAAMMTQKAHALGMSHTLYRNASGLPNDQQLTTARDLIILGRAIQERFPREYGYFSTRVFVYDGRSHFNHNHLLGRVEGMDGIKTGYTRASGFNLLTSVRRDGRHIISVVLGGTTAAGRDAIMADLVDRNLELASVGTRNAPVVAERAVEEEPMQVAAIPPAPPPRQEPVRQLEPVRLAEPAPAAVAVIAPKPRLQVVAAAATGPMSLVPPAPVPAEAAPAPVPRPRLAVVSGAPRAVAADQTASIGAKPEHKRIVIDGSTSLQPVAASAFAPTSTPATLRWVAGPAPAAGRSATSKSLDARIAKATVAPLPKAEAAKNGSTGRSVVARAEPVVPAPAAPAAEPALSRSGWVIQIGATDDAGKANELLSRAKLQDHAGLASATAFTEKVQKGDVTLYRARFAGLEPNQAEAACKSLKRSGFDCFATKN